MKKSFFTLSLLLVSLAAFAADKKIVFLAGPPSHGPGEHEYRAGLLLFKSCLDQMPGISTAIYTNGWPDDPLLQDDRLKTLGAVMDQGAGLVCLHYAVEPTIDKGEKEFLDWMGGAFEINWSVNPTWTADFKTLPEHPITRGVQPFKMHDEWYFHMRFRDGMQGVTPILSAVPDASTTNRADGPHEDNPAVRAAVAAGEPQVLAWAAERPNGGRGFGYTGGHYHKNWANENTRKLVLNAILWTAKIDVPPNGVECELAPGQINENQDAKGKRD